MIKPQPIKFADQTDHCVPWSYSAEQVFIDEEDAGQGSHPPYPLVAMLSVRAYDAEVSFEVAIGKEAQIDALIAALELTKARMKVQKAEYALSVLQRQAQLLEAKQ